MRSLLAAKPMRVRPSEKSLEEVTASRSWPTEKIELGTMRMRRPDLTRPDMVSAMSLDD